MKKSCKYCGTVFETNRKSKTYCSYFCFAEDMVKKGVYSKNPAIKQKMRYNAIKDSLPKKQCER